MPSLSIAGDLLTGIALVALLVVEAKGVRAAKWIAKPLASTGFLLVALGAGALGTRYGTTVLVGLVLCWIGDLLLIPQSKLIFQLGLGSFLAGHVAFAVAFVREGIDRRWAGGAAVGLALVALVVGRWLLPHVEKKMRPPVIAYIVVISAMVATAIGSTALHRRWIVLAGAVAFYLSDLSVARDTFVNKQFLNRLWGLPMYYAAVLLLAWSVAG